MKWMLLMLIGAASSVEAGDIVVRASGKYGGKTVSLATNATSLVHLNWDGVLAGGQYDIRAFLDGERVILVEHTMSANDGIVNDTTSKTIFPTNKLPQTVTINQTTVTVFRVEQENKKQDSPQRTVPVSLTHDGSANDK